MQTASDNILEQHHKRLDLIADRQHDQLRALSRLYKSEVELIATRTRLRTSLSEHRSKPSTSLILEINSILQDASSADPNILETSILNSSGKVVSSTSTHPAAVNAEKGNKNSNFQLIPWDNELGIAVSYNREIFLQEEKVGSIQVVFSAVPLIAVAADRRGLGTTGETILASKEANGSALILHGLRFSSSTPPNRLIAAENPSHPLVDALGQEEVSKTIRYVDYRGVPVAAVMKKLTPFDLALICKIDISEIEMPLTAVKQRALLWLGLVGLTSLLLSLIIARKSTGQLKDLANAAQQISEGNFQANVPVESNDEIGTLASAFNSMTDSIQLLTRKLEIQVLQRTTELSETSEELLSLDALYTAILDNTPAVIFIKDPEGRYIYINKRYEDLFNLSQSDVTGKTDYEIFPREFADRFRLNDREVLESGEMIEREETAPHPDGTHTYVSLKFPLRDAEDQIYAVAGIATDITERKQAEEEIRKSRDFLTTVVDLVPAMIFIKDAKDLRFVLFNKAGTEITGFRAEELIGKNDFDFFPKEQAEFFTEIDQKVISSGEILDIPDETIATKDRGERILHTRKVSLFNNGGKPGYLLGISLDVTEMREAEARIAALNAELEERIAERTKELENANAILTAQNRELDQFAYLASHDLQAPLRKVISFADFLVEDAADQLPEPAREHLARITTAASQMRHLIQDLLNYSRTGRRNIDFAQVSLSDCCSQALDNLALDLEDAKAAIVSCELPEVTGEETLLTQLYQNLIENALKFRRADTLLRIELTREIKDGANIFGVKDNGLGIEPRNAERIFDPFNRINGQINHSGTGIGLALCQKIVERHDGVIWVESNLGEGAHFKFTIPKTIKANSSSPEELDTTDIKSTVNTP